MGFFDNLGQNLLKNVNAEVLTKKNINTSNVYSPTTSTTTSYAPIYSPTITIDKSPTIQISSPYATATTKKEDFISPNITNTPTLSTDLTPSVETGGLTSSDSLFSGLSSILIPAAIGGGVYLFLKYKIPKQKGDKK